MTRKRDKGTFWGDRNTDCDNIHVYMSLLKCIELYDKKKVKLLYINYTSMNLILGLPLCGSGVKNMPAVQETQETQVRSLGGEDPLEECMATHSSILAWRIPLTEAGCSLWGRRV